MANKRKIAPDVRPWKTPLHCQICGSFETKDNEVRYADLFGKFICAKCMNGDISIEDVEKWKK